ncbi:MAG: family 16 glycoside hydrolase, partial [Candidatus Thermoplasmatota archaeon]
LTLKEWCKRIFVGTTTYTQFTDKPFSPSGTFAPPPTSISGWVKNQTDKEIYGAIVQAVDPADTKIVRGAGYANKSGKYVIVNLNGGITYRLIAYADDSSATYASDITALAENDTPNINFTISIKNDTGIDKIDNFVDEGTYSMGTYDINATVKNYGTTTQDSFEVDCIIREVPRVWKEDFNDGVADGFTEVAGTWSVADGVYKQTGTGESMALVGDASWKNYTVEAKIKIVGTAISASPPRGGLAFNSSDLSNNYLFRIAPEAMNNTGLFKEIDGSSTTLNSIPFLPVRDRWYTLKVVVRGTSIKCYIDGTWVYERVDSDLWAIGKIGFWCNGGEVWFDDLYVWNVTPKTEPLWKSIGITEEKEVYRITQKTYTTLGSGATKTLPWPFSFTKEGWYRIIVITKQATQNWINDYQNIMINISGGVAPPKVLVKAPNGEEVLKGGDSFNISWEVTAGTNPLATSPVSIYYSTTGVAGPWTLIVADQPASGIYQWTVPSEQSTDCFVKIEAKDDVGNIGLDVSNKSFTIKVPGKLYTFELGWNPLCLTFSKATITKASELANEIGGNCTKVANWTGSAFVIYDRATATNDFVLENGRGYLVWIVNGTTKFVLDGTKITSTTTALIKGWNNVGLFNTSFTKASQLAANIGDCEAVAYWDDNLGRFVAYYVAVNINDFGLEAGKGYLVFVTVAKSWTQTA